MIAGIGPLDCQDHRRRIGEGSASAARQRRGSRARAPALLRLACSATWPPRTVDTLEQAEQLSVKALQGEADTREVVDAVMSAEQSLQAAVAIRDKIVTRLSRNQPHGDLR